MSLELKNKKIIRLIAVFIPCLIGITGLLLLLTDSGWTRFDCMALDFFYRAAVNHGYGPQISPRIVYVAITDESYDYFAGNTLDRRDMARVNDALEMLGTELIVYDIIFARPSSPESDRAFLKSLQAHGKVYLPIGFEYADNPGEFKWRKGLAYRRFRSDYLKKPVEKGRGRPFYAVRASMQLDSFARAAFGAGHISGSKDPDGVSRHMIMLLKIGDRYVPALALSAFLEYVGVPFESVTVEWGEKIHIPAAKDSLLENAVDIPIDKKGRAFIPYAQKWTHEFKNMSVHSLLNYMTDENIRGNLADFFEGNFIFIGDVSVGATDIGNTPLDKNAPLLINHATMMNALLTNTFYAKWPMLNIFGLIVIIGFCLGISALPRASWSFYSTGLAIFFLLIGLTWMQLIHFVLFPVVTTTGSLILLFGGILIAMEFTVSKERAFIKEAFARYVPQKVVDRLLVSPELLQMGGEERIMSVLFSDIAGFTSIAEKMPPMGLASLLNEYLTEMTRIVLEEEGIIDKYEGDALMAEFGAPLSMKAHADRAVRTGIKMQNRLKQLRTIWRENGRPELRCRVGVNSGPMIVGNMGSEQVFDYTVLGDAVNIAARLESANKYYNTELMISEYTFDLLTPGLFKTRLLDVIKLKGKAEPVKVYEVYGEQNDIIEKEVYYTLYQDAFEDYLGRDFASAKEKFTAALDVKPDDPAAGQMIDRIEAINPEEISEDWDGSIVFLTK